MWFPVINSRDWHRNRESLCAETRLDEMAKRKLISKLFFNHFHLFFASFFLSSVCSFLSHQDSLTHYLSSVSASADVAEHLLSAAAISNILNFLMSPSFKVNMKQHSENHLLLLPKCATQKCITGHLMRKKMYPSRFNWKWAFHIKIMTNLN